MNSPTPRQPRTRERGITHISSFDVPNVLFMIKVLKYSGASSMFLTAMPTVLRAMINGLVDPAYDCERNSIEMSPRTNS